MTEKRKREEGETRGLFLSLSFFLFVHLSFSFLLFFLFLFVLLFLFLFVHRKRPKVCRGLCERSSPLARPARATAESSNGEPATFGGPIIEIWLWWSKPLGSHFGGFRCTTHFRTCFSGWIESDVHMGVRFGFCPMAISWFLAMLASLAQRSEDFGPDSGPPPSGVASKVVVRMQKGQIDTRGHVFCTLLFSSSRCCFSARKF